MTGPPDDERQLTQLIQATRRGEDEARERLFSVIYEELRSIARRRPGVGRYGHTMQATVLANEAFIHLEKHFSVPFSREIENREIFFRTVALAMREILKDYWRAKNAQRRKPPGTREPIDEVANVVADALREEFDAAEFLDLDAGLEALEKDHPVLFDVVLLRYFAGRSTEEIASLKKVSGTKVKNDLRVAKLRLRRILGDERPEA